jgi:light-regulated signal transduction histidine kinase (bacteriophytochrome)
LKAEKKIKEFNLQLEGRVRERTAQLEATNRELEAFSFSVSHDLRAPLRSVDSFSKILMEEHQNQLNREALDLLRRVRTGSQRMSQLIDDLLKLSRISRSELSRELVYLSEVCRSICGDLHNSDPARRVQFKIADDLAAFGDPQLLRVVLENLLGNAWKFSSKKTEAVIEFGEIERSEEEKQGQNGKSVFYIRDNGVGFDPDYASKLFNPFHRLHNSNEFPGSGIGLATVQRIINRHGGEIWAESELNKGATFYFRL